MIEVKFSDTFNRHLDTRLTKPQLVKAMDVIYLFIEHPDHPELRNHKLYGKWKGYRSISVEGDLRLHYRILDTDSVIFAAAGSHEQLYRD
jgi:addiction module RelE/StbE family toxin